MPRGGGWGRRGTLSVGVLGVGAPSGDTQGGAGGTQTPPEVEAGAPRRSGNIRFGLVVSGNGSADVTRPGTLVVPIQETGDLPWHPPDAVQAALG